MYKNDDEDIEYFVNALHFLNDMQWLYNSPVTKLLVDGHLNKFPQEWLNTLENINNDELNDFVVHKKYENEWPSSLKLFLHKCDTLDKLQNRTTLQTYPLPKIFFKGLSLKKQHEILHLANIVHLECLKKGIKTIVDLGAGLGYVCQLLHYLYNYQVLGLEGSSQNVETVKFRQRKYYPESLDRVKYICCKLTQDSAIIVDELVKKAFEDHGDICLIGLHACGDLSVDIFKIFHDLPDANLLILLPCCYHKLTVDKQNYSHKEYFTNFPISNTFVEAVQTTQLDIGRFLKRSFLRLACQESADRWQGMSENSHSEHSFHVLARAVLELFTVKNGFYLHKNVQKGTRKSQCRDFNMYLEDCMKRYSFKIITNEDEDLKNDVLNSIEIKERMKILWTENCHLIKVVEIYTALQMLMQSVAESVVLTDRLCWLKERGFSTKIIPVTSRKLSPRCHAILASK